MEGRLTLEGREEATGPVDEVGENSLQVGHRGLLQHHTHGGKRLVCRGERTLIIHHPGGNRAEIGHVIEREGGAGVTDANQLQRGDGPLGVAGGAKGTQLLQRAVETSRGKGGVDERGKSVLGGVGEGVEEEELVGGVPRENGQKRLQARDGGGREGGGAERILEEREEEGGEEEGVGAGEECVESSVAIISIITAIITTTTIITAIITTTTTNTTTTATATTYKRERGEKTLREESLQIHCRQRLSVTAQPIGTKMPIENKIPLKRREERRRNWNLPDTPQRTATLRSPIHSTSEFT